jgi:hypothetical protein
MEKMGKIGISWSVDVMRDVMRFVKTSKIRV